jgi:EAL domain-containing protein (putative c-di-GMP-specific phosphodiesterase class I)/GGDEF domain-containing protein/CBS domain-containing protein
MSFLLNELTKILKGKFLTPYFLPIVSLPEMKIMAYKAIIHGPSDSPLHSLRSLLDSAERFNLSAKLEYICEEITLNRYASLNIKEKLFIVINPSVAQQPDFKKKEILKYMDKLGIDPASIIIELTEFKPIDNFKLIRNAVTYYRKLDFETAISYLGAAYLGFSRWSELQISYVEIDRHFIRGIQDDPLKINLVRSIQDIASSFNCKLIAEGIETEDEFKTIEKLGITHGHGHYFGRPMLIPLKKIDPALFVVSDKTDKFNTIKAAHIAQSIAPISSETTISQVMKLFHENSDINILPLVDKQAASGIIFREPFLLKLLSSQYGMALYGKKPIQTFIDKTPLSFDQNTSIELISTQLTSSMRNDPAFIITDAGKYTGIGTTLDLLEEITRQQIYNAKHANPLTLLPGSVPINHKINQLMASKIPFSFGYFDLDYFKPFNDVYGYNTGDDIIKLVAHILTQHIPTESGWVGHIGGDDFIVIILGNDWFERCENILEAFKMAIPNYYKDEDINAGGIFTENRQGVKCFFPMLSLSAGLVDPVSVSQCQSHVDIADLASQSKKQAKKIEGNSFFINQRKVTK